MIFGIGMDMVDARRLVRPLSEFETRFLERLLMPSEIQALFKKMERFKAFSTEAQSIQRLSINVAKYFAAKEACAKAMGTGFAGGVSLRDMEVSRDVLGKPMIYLFGKTLEILQNLTPQGQRAHLHLSLCDEYPYAQAQVILEMY